MDVNYIDPFWEAFTTVMPQLGFTHVEKKGLSLKEKFIESPGIVVIIGLIGDIKGNIIYAMDIPHAKKIASIMMMGMPVEDFNELAQSAISELINMLTASVATNFSKDHISVDISTPTLIEGNFKVNTTTDKVTCLEIEADGAVIEVNISLEKNAV